jgi:hypothetical protein
MRQYFRPIVSGVSDFVNGALERYQKERSGKLTLQELRSSFLASNDTPMQEIVFYYVFEMFRLRKVLEDIGHDLTENVFGDLLQSDILFDICLIVDNIIRHKNPNKNDKRKRLLFSDQLKFLSDKKLIHLDSSIGKLGKDFTADFSDTLKKLLDSTYSFPDENTMPIDVDFAISLGFRNFGAHKIEDQSIISERFDQIYQRILNVLFFCIESLFNDEIGVDDKSVKIIDITLGKDVISSENSTCYDLAPASSTGSYRLITGPKESGSDRGIDD